VLHTATLHKPHVATHSRQDFVDTNITGTLNLLEAAVANHVRSFVFTSTTSTFGDALTPPPGAPAVWITEDVVPIPKNIYGTTKVAAEDLFHLHQWRGREAVSVRMRRANARTVSHTVIEVRELTVSLAYRPADAAESVSITVAA
jgi:nucleoside-diphosphate-sugar epimerase